MHWAARFGDRKTVKLLIQKKAKIFIPDSQGLFPIDIAGYFQHTEVVKLLVDYSIECFKLLSETATMSQLKEDFILGEVVYDEDLFLHSDKFLSSPLYASKLLYWAANNKLNTFE